VLTELREQAQRELVAARPAIHEHRAGRPRGPRHEGGLAHHQIEALAGHGREPVSEPGLHVGDAVHEQVGPGHHQGARLDVGRDHTLGHGREHHGDGAGPAAEIERQPRAVPGREGRPAELDRARGEAHGAIPSGRRGHVVREHEELVEQREHEPRHEAPAPRDHHPSLDQAVEQGPEQRARVGLGHRVREHPHAHGGGRGAAERPQRVQARRPRQERWHLGARGQDGRGRTRREPGAHEAAAQLAELGRRQALEIINERTVVRSLLLGLGRWLGHGGLLGSCRHFMASSSAFV
jgi:hypothetical protein